MRLPMSALVGRCSTVPVRSHSLSCIRAFSAALALFAAAGPALSAEKDVPIRMDDRQMRAAGIELARVEPEGGTAQTVLPGTVVVPPQQLLVVAAPAAGLIEAVLTAPNEAVRAGQPLARLRSP